MHLKREDFIMKRETVYLWKLSVIAGLACGIFAMLVFFCPAPTNTWVQFALYGLAITFGCGPDPKKIPNFLACLFAGVVWGIIVALLGTFWASIGITGFWNNLVNVGVVTFLACIVHLIFLPKTIFDNLAVVFVGICTYLAINGPVVPINLPYAGAAVLALWCGSLIAVSLNPITKLFHKE